MKIIMQLAQGLEVQAGYFFGDWESTAIKRKDAETLRPKTQRRGKIATLRLCVFALK
jgi:hypothetical protein